jgi:acyl-CoA thioesterase
MAEGEITLGAQHMNTRDVVHGGCIFSLMDNVAGSAALTTGNWVTAANSDVMFLRPALQTKKLRARAEVLKSGRALIIAEIQVWNDADELIAKGSITFFRLPGAPECV